jgi:hypothetical protein
MLKEINIQTEDNIGLSGIHTQSHNRTPSGGGRYYENETNCLVFTKFSSQAVNISLLNALQK